MMSECSVVVWEGVDWTEMDGVDVWKKEAANGGRALLVNRLCKSLNFLFSCPSCGPQGSVRRLRPAPVAQTPQHDHGR